MTDAKYDVLGIGNAIFDVLVQTDEGFLSSHGMTKGGMALIDEARAAAIYRDMGPATEMSGGSGANTIVGLAGFGARAAFIGKVKNDELGRAFAHDIRAGGRWIIHNNGACRNDLITGRCSNRCRGGSCAAGHFKLAEHAGLFVSGQKTAVRK